MNHASLMVLRKSSPLNMSSKATESAVVIDRPTMNQILFEDPPPRRAAGTRTGLSVRLAINGVYPFHEISCVKMNRHIVDYD